VPVANSGTSLYEEIVTTATQSTNVASVTNHVFLAATPEQFYYDLDGNLLSDGRFTNQWDMENRLVQMESLSTAPAASKRKLTIEYDYQGRRIRKRVFNWDTVSNNYSAIPASDTKFIYDGWNLLAELNATNNAIVRSYLWGLDLSGTLQGAGGVGGLAAVKPAGVPAHFPAYDLNGNIIGLVDGSDGSTSAIYEYAPFGEVLRATGPISRENPFRFSTKYQDDETGLNYYGYRYYSASLGRWLNEDPLAEAGGMNLFGFVANDSVNRIDPLGLEWYKPWTWEFFNPSYQGPTYWGATDAAPRETTPAHVTATRAQDYAENLAPGDVPTLASFHGEAMAEGAQHAVTFRDELGREFTIQLVLQGTLKATEPFLTKLVEKTLKKGGTLWTKICPKAGEEINYLYQKVGPKGEHLKFGITKNPPKRYSPGELGDGDLRIIAKGPREEMLRLERSLHETLPIGREEGQKFYIQKQIEKGLKPPPYN
jgi:RHS repeat-associated protein